MKLATTAAMCRLRPDGPKQTDMESIPYLAEAGFDAIDMCFFYAVGDPNSELKREDYRQWAHEARKRIADRGLYITQSHSPNHNFHHKGGDADELTHLMLDRSMEATGILGAKWTVMHPVTIVDALTSRETHDENVKFFHKKLDVAEKFGVGIAIENSFDTVNYVGDHGGRRVNYTQITDNIVRSRHRYGSDLGELLELVDALKQHHDNVGICWDTGHGNLAGVNQPDSIRLMGKRLKALHINDNYGVYDDHFVPYHGVIGCWQEILRALHDIGFENDLCYEATLFPRHVPTELLPDTLRYSVTIGRQLLAAYARIEDDAQ